MNAFKTLQEDFDFLKDFNQTINNYNREKVEKEKNGKFSKHPKYLTSDTENSLLRTARTITKSFDDATIDDNHSIDKLESLKVSLLQIDRSDDDDDDDVGDGDDELLLLNKTTGTTKKTACRNLNSKGGSVTNYEFDKRFKIYVGKSMRLLTEIRLFISKGANVPDGEEEYNKRLRGLQEFSSRFSRMYLYPIGQLIKELSLPMKPGTIAIVNQKLLKCYQIIVQALQTYLNHLPTSIGNCNCDKFKLLLEQIVYIYQFLDILKGSDDGETSEFIEALRSSVEMTFDEVDKFQTNIAQKKKSKTVKKKKEVKNKIKKKPNNRYAMYESSQLILTNRNKFHVPSRYKTATFKHRPPLEKPQILVLPKLKEQSSCTLKNTPITTPFNEDEIKTVVQYDNETVDHENLTDQTTKIVENDTKINGDIDKDDEIKNALLVLKDYLGNDYVEISKKVAGNLPENNCQEFVFVENIIDNNNQTDLKKLKSNWKEPTVTVTGAKNAKLICIRDDNSVIEDENEDEDRANDNNNNNKPIISSEAQTDINQIKSNNQTAVMKRLPKLTNSLQLLSDDYITKLIQDKLNFLIYCKGNPLYDESLKFWTQLGKISDRLINEHLKSIMDEMQIVMNKIVECVYKSEFQL